MIAPALLTVDLVADALGWPSASDVINPAGSGPSVFARLAQDKLGRALARFSEDGCAKVGILTSDPDSPATEAPIAIVVEFQTRVRSETLRELQRLAWNFSHSPTVITIEPDIVRVWSCCETPSPDRSLDDYLVHDIQAADLAIAGLTLLESRAAQALHWLNLVSGEFFTARAARFDRDGRADQMLLRNLRHIREELKAQGLDDDDVCHDLLARVIFMQFLFDRKDGDGVAALSSETLKQLHKDGVLSRLYTSLEGILRDYEDSYSLFDWLNGKFNGDLFPGKGNTQEERARGWETERGVVNAAHLATLAGFIAGTIDFPTGQACLWPQYSFDVIPLEFISSIYETFVTERAAQDGIFYTPPHLVDFVLDRVLAWDSKDWDLKILDPACGSGIFLVKAFQRLVHRWKLANPHRQIRAETLRHLLTRNLLGVDKDSHAVRVACFSLYLAMCDEIEPRHYWTQVRFPSMRGERLVCSDFFEEAPGFDTQSNSEAYDLIIGNAPWGSNVATEKAVAWAKDEAHPWSVTNKDMGSLFLAKSACLVKAKGRISLIQSANSLLFNGRKTALLFRKQLFSRHSIEAIYNLSALRFKVFKRKNHVKKMSISPACVVVMGRSEPKADSKIAYVSPKTLPSVVDDFTIIIEPDDYKWVYTSDAATDPYVWPTLMWGTARDLVLLRKLQALPCLARLSDEKAARTREGIIFGDRKKAIPSQGGRRLFVGKKFPEGSPIHMEAADVPVAHDIRAHSRDSTDFSAFALPQLLIKQGWQLGTQRFQARLVRSADAEGILCNQSYVTVHAASDQLEAACLSYNSLLAAYFLQLTDGRMAAYRPEATVRDLLNVPLPPVTEGLLNDIHTSSDIDERMFVALHLKDAERALVEDMVNITMSDFRSDGDLPGSRHTCNPQAEDPEEVLKNYSEYFVRVLKAGFGRNKTIRATVFSPPPAERLPYRLLAFELIQGSDSTGIQTVAIRAPELLSKFQALSQNARDGGARGRQSLLARRVARVYDGHGRHPTIFILKPDAVRYWTRTAAFNDGDEVAIDLFRWLSTSSERRALS